MDNPHIMDNKLTHIVGGILRKDGRILLCLRHRNREHYPGVWDVPGGHVNTHESLQDALARELREELGIGADVPSGPAWLTYRSDELDFHLFLIERWHGEIRNCAPLEHEDLRWMSRDDLLEISLAHPMYEPILMRAFECQLC